MINEFFIKSSLVELKKIGYDVVDFALLYNSSNELDACVFKVKYDESYLYSMVYSNANFSFESSILQPIELLIDMYNDNNINKRRLTYFIDSICFDKACFDSRKLHSHCQDADDIFEDLSCKYGSAKEFIENIDSIDLNLILQNNC